MSYASYVAAVLADSPGLFWKCDEAAGVLLDSSGNGRDMSDALGITAYSLPGPAAGAESVQGNQRAYRASAAGLTGGSFSLEFWINIATVGGGAGLLVCMGDPVIGNGYGVVNPSGAAGPIMCTQTGLGAGSNGCQSDAFLPLGVLRYIVVTRDAGGTWRMYLDSVLQAGTGTGFAVPDSGPSLWNGSSNTAPAVFGSSGTISNLAWYPSELSAARVLAHYNAMTGAASGAICDDRRRRR